MQKFGLGPSSIDLDSVPSFSRPSRSCRKRVLSQSKLDTFFSPNAAAASGLFSLSDSFLSIPSAKKKKRPTPSRAKNSAKRKLSTGKAAVTTKAPSSAKKRKDHRLSKTGMSKKSPTGLKSPGNSRSMSLLNKAKRFKQLDLKNSLVDRSSLTPIELAELKLSAEFERQRQLAQLEEDKQRRKEARLRRIREQQERRRLEKLRQKEWLKPREDLLCDDSKVGEKLRRLQRVLFYFCDTKNACADHALDIVS